MTNSKEERAGLVTSDTVRSSYCLEGTKKEKFTKFEINILKT